MGAAESLSIPRNLWTRAEVDRLCLDGLSLELINGELTDRMGKKPPQVYWKKRTSRLINCLLGGEYVRSEDPIDVALPITRPANQNRT